MNFNADVCDIIPPASCMDGINMSIKSEYLSKSCKHIVIISLSDKMPNARNKIKRGTGFLTFGIFTTIFLLVFPDLPKPPPTGATIFTESVRTGFDKFSETERISAEYRK